MPGAAGATSWQHFETGLVVRLVLAVIVWVFSSYFLHSAMRVLQIDSWNYAFKD